MTTKTVLALMILIAVAAEVPAQPAAGAEYPGAGGGNPWIPPWVAAAPWFPQWPRCTFIGSSCINCSTKQICTRIGSIQKVCADPLMPYCNLGECSATPSAKCGTPLAANGQ